MKEPRDQSSPNVRGFGLVGLTTLDTGDNRLAFRVQPFCDSIGIGKTKFYELVREGKIKTVVIGGRQLVPAAEAERLVREGCE